MGDPREIEVVGDDVSRRVLGLPGREQLPQRLGWLSWYGPTKFLQKSDLPYAPGAGSPPFVSEVYHDYYRWPLRECKLYDRWHEETAWGQLFRRYQREGCLAGPEPVVS